MYSDLSVGVDSVASIPGRVGSSSAEGTFGKEGGGGKRSKKQASLLSRFGGDTTKSTPWLSGFGSANINLTRTEEKGSQDSGAGRQASVEYLFRPEVSMLGEGSAISGPAASTAAAVLLGSSGEDGAADSLPASTPASVARRGVSLPELDMDSYTVQSKKDNTWQFVGRNISPFEKPATRHDIMVLERKLQIVYDFIQSKQHGRRAGRSSKKKQGLSSVATKKEQLQMTNVVAVLEQDLTEMEQEISKLVSYRTKKKEDKLLKEALRHALTNALFEQKWTDLILGEVQQQVAVTCMERGRLLNRLKSRMGSIFGTLKGCQEQLLRALERSYEECTQLSTELRSTKEHERELEIALETKRQEAVAEVRTEMRAEIEKAHQQAKDAEDKRARANESLGVLQQIFQDFRDDAEGMRVADLRETCSALERKLESREAELKKLRPFKKKLEDMSNDTDMLKSRIESLEEELSQCKEELKQRDTMCEDLMRRESERLSAMEVAMASGLKPEEAMLQLAGSGGAGATKQIDAGDQQQQQQQQQGEMEQKGDQGGKTKDEGQTQLKMSDQQQTQEQKTQQGSTQQNVPAYLLVAPYDAGLVQQSGEAVVATEKKKKHYVCKAYRSLLPNLMGYRPERDRSWTMRCIRALLRAKQRDSATRSYTQSVVRFPEFVWAWFQPRKEDLADMLDDEVDAALAEADEMRWAIYYGAKTLSKELPEARLFFNFLDEKYGEDELSFFLHCCSVLDGHGYELGGSDWGEGIEAGDITAMREDDDTYGKPVIPEVIFVSLAAVKATIATVMVKAGEEERQQLFEHLAEKSVPSRGRLLNLDFDDILVQRSYELQRCVESGSFLRVLLQEYREEQAHRRAAIRIMFNTAGRSVPGDGASPGADEDGARDGGVGGSEAAGEASPDLPMDMSQFTEIVRSLNGNLSNFEVAALFRESFELGDDSVTFDSFMKAAEARSFFSSCLRLPRFVGAAHTTGGYVRRADDDLGNRETISKSQREKLMGLVHVKSQLFMPDLAAYHKKLDAGTDYELSRLQRAFHEEIQRGLGIDSDGSVRQADGRRALCAYRRLLMFMAFVRMQDREQYGEIGGDKRVVDNARREIEMLETIVRDFDNAERVMKMRKIYTSVCAARIQRTWRKRNDKLGGAPLKVKKFMNSSFKPGTRHVVRSLSWLYSMIERTYVDKLKADIRAMELHRERPSLHEVLYDMMLSRMGTKELADRVVHDLFTTLRDFMNDLPRAAVFAKLCGIVETSEDALLSANLQGVDFYLRTLLSLRPPEFLEGSVKLFPDHDKKGKSLVMVGRATDVVRRMFSEKFLMVPEEEVEVLVEKTKGMTTKKERDRIDLDRFLSMCLRKWCECQQRRTANMRSLFKAGNVNLDNILNLDEFNTLFTELRDQMGVSPVDKMDCVALYRKASLLAEPQPFIHDRAFLQTVNVYVDNHVIVNMTDFVNRAQNAKKKGKKKSSKASEESRWIGAGSMPIFVPPRNGNAELELLKNTYTPFKDSIAELLKEMQSVTNFILPASSSGADAEGAPPSPSVAKLKRRSSFMMARPKAVTNNDCADALACYEAFNETYEKAQAEAGGDDGCSLETLSEAEDRFSKMLGSLQRLRVVNSMKGNGAKAGGKLMTVDDVWSR